MNQPSRFLRTLVLAGVLILPVFPFPNLAADDDAVLHKQRTALIARHDKNGDGRLDAAERERMRLALKEERLKPGSSGSSEVPADVLADYDTNKDGSMEDSEWANARVGEQAILTKQFDADKDGSLDAKEIDAMMHFIRTEKVRYSRDYFAYMLKFDKNDNGQFDGEEYPTAQAAEGGVVKQTYDTNANGLLDAEELAKLRTDLAKGLIPGFFARFAREIARGGNEGGYLEAQKKALEFDTNHDRLASGEELKRAREAQRSTK